MNDRELDAAVAREVMGLEMAGPCESHETAILRVRDGGKWRPVPRYSTDGNAMLAVCAKIGADGYVVGMSLLADGGWWTAIEPAKGEPGRFEGMAPTLPRAVAEAALAAVRARKEANA